MKILPNILILVLSFAGTVFCGNPDTNKVKSNWKNELNARLNLTQIGFNNWISGGENAFSWVSMIDGAYTYKDSSFYWKTSHRFSYGQTKQGDREYRKNEDLFDFSSVVSYIIGWKVDPYFSITGRTQFAKGYNFNGDTKTTISDFLDPGYFTQNFGFQYIPTISNGTLSFRAGLSLKETITKYFNTFSDDPKTPEIEKTKVELGSEFAADYEQKFNSTLILKSKMEIFANYKRLDETVVRWDNLMTLQLLKYLAISINGVIYYNKIESRQCQWKEIIGLGFYYSFM